MPAGLWRGRSTLDSVLETVVRVLREGVEPTYEWTLFAGTGAPVISRRTLWRWTVLVRTRLVGSAWTWLGSRLGLSWSDELDAAEQLERVLDHLAEPVLLAFRAATGRAVLDRPTAMASRARSTTRRVVGRLAPRAPHDSSSAMRPRGSWLQPRRRGPPAPEPRGD
jgi:hypothetical protein